MFSTAWCPTHHTCNLEQATWHKRKSYMDVQTYHLPLAQYAQTCIQYGPDKTRFALTKGFTYVKTWSRLSTLRTVCLAWMYTCLNVPRSAVPGWAVHWLSWPTNCSHELQAYNNICGLKLWETRGKTSSRMVRMGLKSSGYFAWELFSSERVHPHL